MDIRTIRSIAGLHPEEGLIEPGAKSQDVLSEENIHRWWSEVQLFVPDMHIWDEFREQIMVLGILPVLPGTRYITLHKTRHGPGSTLYTDAYRHEVFVKILKTMRKRGVEIMRFN